MRFLTVLNECYSVVKTHILMMIPLPPLTSVFSMVLQHERQLGLGLDEIDDSLAIGNAVDSKKYYKGKNSGGKVCTYCGRPGHTVDTCFRKHGFPPGYKKGNGGYIHNIASDGDELDGRTETNSLHDNKELIVSGLTNDECRTLIGLLQKTNMQKSAAIADLQGVQINQTCVGKGSTSGKKNNEGTEHVFSCRIVKDDQIWIVDSGATDHICTSMFWFDNYHAIDPVPVNLPNGNVVMAQLSGDVRISDGLVLRMLYSYQSSTLTYCPSLN